MSAAILAGCSSGGHADTSTRVTGATAPRPRLAASVTVVLKDARGESGSMTMSVSPDAVSAGRIRFVVENVGTVTHEMIVVRKQDTSALALLGDGSVSERGIAGAVRNIAPHTTRTRTLVLTAGSYELLCNIKRHYQSGMRVPFAVG